MAHQKEKVIKDTSERWLLTYADLMNLLLIFFIVLYAMSQVDQAKVEQLAASLQAAFGQGTGYVAPGGNTVVPLPGTLEVSPVIPSKLEEQQMEAVREEVNELIKEGGLEGRVDVKMEERGIVISITAQMLFEPGSAKVEPGSRPTIEEIGSVLKRIPGNHIRIEGHTDSDPLSSASEFADNLELSTARANTVYRLLKGAGINPEIMSSAGYGDQRPVAPNDTAGNKAMNRRVNIVILKSIYDTTEPQSIN